MDFLIKTPFCSDYEYFGSEGLLRRHDYCVDIDIDIGVATAQYVLDVRSFDHFWFPTKRRAYLRGPNLEPIRERLLVSRERAQRKLRNQLGPGEWGILRALLDRLAGAMRS